MVLGVVVRIHRRHEHALETVRNERHQPFGVTPGVGKDRMCMFAKGPDSVGHIEQTIEWRDPEHEEIPPRQHRVDDQKCDHLSCDRRPAAGDEGAGSIVLGCGLRLSEPRHALEYSSKSSDSGDVDKEGKKRRLIDSGVDGAVRILLRSQVAMMSEVPLPGPTSVVGGLRVIQPCAVCRKEQPAVGAKKAPTFAKIPVEIPYMLEDLVLRPRVFLDT